MRTKICTFVLLLCLAFVSTASADYWLGPFDALGYGPTQEDAADGAIYSMDQYVAGIPLGPGEEALPVIGATQWDENEWEYTITFWVLILEDLP